MSIMSVWHAYDPAVKAAWIGAGATLIAAAFGFSAIILQIGAQGRQSRKAIADNEARRIKAAMYEDALRLCRELSDAASNLSNQLLSMYIYFDWVVRASEEGRPYDIPSARFKNISAVHTDFSNAVVKVMFLIENRLIIDPRLTIFRTAFTSTLHDTSDIMYQKFIPNLMPALPVDNPDGGVFPYNWPSTAQIAIIKADAQNMIDALGDASAYSDDLLFELQNLLLGDLFESRLKARQPPDPSKRAITLQNAGALEAWFRANSAWGRQAEAVEEEARRRFQSGEPLS
jgi:hypothetical protein